MTTDNKPSMRPSAHSDGTRANAGTSNTSANGASVPAPSLWDWLYYVVMAVIHSGFPFMNMIFGFRPKWTPEKMEDHSGKVVLVTGANSGTGYETAKAYYDHGAKVYVACRSEERANAAIVAIREGGSRDVRGKMVYKSPSSTPGSLEYINLDLSDLNSVDAAARAILAKEARLDVLFANAGIMATPPGQFTTQGYALQFGTNVVGHQRLISHLLPLLKRTSRNYSAPSRVVLTTSFGHMFAPRGGPANGGIDYAALKRGGTQLGEWAEYGESKWGNIALAKWIDHHHGPKSGVTDGEVLAFSVHPGMVATNLGNHLGPMDLLKSAGPVLAATQLTPAQGALNQLWAANMSVGEATLQSGAYISNVQSIVPPRPDLRYPQAWDKLWDYCEAEARSA